MSDADDSDFDKEAERERLREKYEAEEADRAAAQQMSDLLLKGATMTNTHCGQCGSPIFRQDGQEFCPNCSQAAAQAADAGGGSSSQAAGADAASAGGTPPGAAAGDAGDAADQDLSPDERLRNVVSGETNDAAEAADTGGTSIAERAAASVQSQDQPDQSGDPASADASGSGEPSAPSADDRTPPSTPSIEGDASLADAQQSLLNAITRHARAASEAEPRTARDHLEAASEAAEALATISPEN